MSIKQMARAPGGVAITWSDKSGVDHLTRALEQLSSGNFGQAASRSLNKVGGKARTQVRRALTRQTGLPRRTIVQAVRERLSSASSLTHTLSSSGGNIRLKYFKASETDEGVMASPFGQKRIFPGAFMKAGSFPDRVETSAFGGHAMYRTGSGKWPVRAARSGVVIPDEMVTGATQTAWAHMVERELPRRLVQDLSRAGAGVFA